MSIAAEKHMLESIEESLCDLLTVSQLNEVVDQLSEIISSYQIEHNQPVDNNIHVDLLEEFLSAKSLEGRSAKTIEHYRYVITKLLKFVRVPVSKISILDLRNYLSSRKSLGISDVTLEGDREVFSSFFGWLFKESLIPANPCVNLNPIKCVKKVRKPYTSVDLEQLKEHCSEVRDKAIVSFLLATGCRISEMCSLNIDDVDLDRLECIVLGKGNKERKVYLDDVALFYIKAYIESRDDNNPALFIGRNKQRLQPGGVRAMLKQVEEKSGVTNVHPHRFRRTLATNLIQHGMPIQEVATILGHETLDTTMTYVYLNNNSVKSSYNKYFS